MSESQGDGVTLTVYFEDPYWVAVLERRRGGTVRATRLVLGGEPTDTELYHLLLRRGTALLAAADAAPAVPASERAATDRPVNPKRLARQAARQAAEHRPSTAAQEAVSRAYHQRRDEARADDREAREQDRERRRELRRARAKARHRGR